MIRTGSRLLAAALCVAAAGCGGGGSSSDNPLQELTPGQRRSAADRALTLVAGRPSDLGYRLVLAPSAPGVRAITDRHRRTITLFVRRGEVPHLLAHDLAHELGHAYDDRAMNDAERRAYLLRRGVPDATWWPGKQLSDYASGAGDFAEVYALCHAASPEFRSTLAPRPASPCSVLPPGARSGTMGSER